MRARNNSTNSYPVPKAISEYYKANADKYESEWDCYWSLIDAWAKADIAAGDTVVYEATTREAGDFINWMNSGKYSSNTSTFSYSGNGAVVSNLGNNKIEDVLEFDMTSSAEKGVVHGVSGPNPFIDESAAHAISYERAMWEAYTFIQENISGKGISFYPVYAPLRTNGTASNGSHYDYTRTTNYIGHCFMNMLAGGEAIFFDANNVTFFDDIKAEIVEGSTTASGEPVIPFVEDFIGVDFDFTGEKIVLSFNGVAYTTMRLYDTISGEILYNGRNINEYAPDKYREHIGAVFQDYKVFAATIAENVMGGEYTDADEEAVMSALRAASFDEKLKQLPNGIHSQLTTEFSKEGVGLSGGESQKIAIARVFARPFELIIMDEPSSALDPIAEYELNQSILKNAEGRTVIFISHRLSTTRMADKIYMFDGGQIVESGSHDELMQLNGKYAEMYRVQTKKYRTAS